MSAELKQEELIDERAAEKVLAGTEGHQIDIVYLYISVELRGEKHAQNKNVFGKLRRNCGFLFIVVPPYLTRAFVFLLCYYDA